MSYVVQVHGHRDLDEAAQAGGPALARLSHLQVFAEVRGKEVATVRESVGREE